MHLSGASPVLTSHSHAIVPFPVERARVPDATHFRSTWLTSSLAALTGRGHREQYERLLGSEHRDAILTAVAGLWLPMEVALAHYGACDRLDLTDSELFEIGVEATGRASATTLAFAVRMARGAGLTPWTILRQYPRIWARTCLGGAIAVFKTGPKDARVEEVGFPLARYRYNRVTMRGILTAVTGKFCSQIYVHEVPRLCDERSLAYRLSWV